MKRLLLPWITLLVLLSTAFLNAEDTENQFPLDIDLNLKEKLFYTFDSDSAVKGLSFEQEVSAAFKIPIKFYTITLDKGYTLY